MEALVIALILVLAIGYLVLKDTPSSCNQDCRQGRDCNCGDKQ